MGFKTVVVLGAGPIGLIAAIEARNYARNVFLIEKRPDYTRQNVPMLGHAFKTHLTDKLEVGEELYANRQSTQDIPTSVLEKTLFAKAERAGVEVLRPAAITQVSGGGKKVNKRYATILLTVEDLDFAKKPKGVFKHPAKFRVLHADLLVIASGGGAAKDQLIIHTLGFQYEKLKAKNYGAYAIFESGDASLTPTYRAQEIVGSLGSPIPLQTTEHNYLLTIFAGLTKTDFKHLQRHTDQLEGVLKKMGNVMFPGLLEDIKQSAKNVMSFKISIQRARQFCSPEYPAVLVGDAAVTPHPATGSGIEAGFRGFEVLTTLYQMLKKASKNTNRTQAFLDFNQQYEILASEKALEGTVHICQNLKTTIETFSDHYVTHALAGTQRSGDRRASTGSSSSGGDPLLHKLTMLTAILDEHVKVAKDYLALIKPHGDAEPQLPAGGAVATLWREIGMTYSFIKELTGDINTLNSRLRELARELQH